MRVVTITNAIIKQNEYKKNSIQFHLFHRGQNYDRRMSATFFADLEMLDPDINSKLGSGTQARQTADTMQRFYLTCVNRFSPHMIVVGYVNLTIA